MHQWWDLWLRWWGGEQLTGARLWGHPLAMWARFGKSLQFVAGLTVLLDLIGPGPLRSFGQRLSTVSWPKSFSIPAEIVTMVISLSSFVIYSIFLTAVMVPNSPLGDELTEIDLSDTWLADGRIDVILLALILTVAMGLTVWLIATQQDTCPKSMVQSWENVAVALFLAPIAIVAAVAILAILLPWAVFIYGICLPLSRGLATLLSRMEPAHPLRWTAFTIFVIGFHFDLLAS